MIARLEKTWFNMQDGAGEDPAEVCIYDDIGLWGIPAKDFINKLAGIKAKKINIRINSGGGDFFDACAIHNAIQGHSAETVCIINALAASAASIVAIAGKRTVISENGFLMIHNVMSAAFGDAEEMRKQGELLDKLCNSLADMYAKKSEGKPEKFLKAMKDETWYDAKEAKRVGLVDEIGTDGEEDENEEEMNRMAPAFAALNKYRRVPERLRKFAASLSQTKPHLTEVTMLKITNKDGKSYIVVDGKEIEVEIPVASIAAPKPADPPAAPAPPAPGDKTSEQLRREGIEQERAYRKDFTTCLNAAGITGKRAEEFEQFYGQPISNIKFMASLAIGLRATAAGEGNADPVKTPEVLATEKETASSAKDETRWHNDQRLRRLHGVLTSNKADAGYKHKLARYLAACAKNRADQADGGGFPTTAGDGGDAIGKLLNNKSVVEYV